MSPSERGRFTAPRRAEPPKPAALEQKGNRQRIPGEVRLRQIDDVGAREIDRLRYTSGIREEERLAVRPCPHRYSLQQLPRDALRGRTRRDLLEPGIVIGEEDGP